MTTRFTQIKLTNDGAFSGEEGPNAFGANFTLFLIGEAWHRGCDFEDLADGFGAGLGTMKGDWSGIRDSSAEAKERMLERALNHLFPSISLDIAGHCDAHNLPLDPEGHCPICDKPPGTDEAEALADAAARAERIIDDIDRARGHGEVPGVDTRGGPNTQARSQQLLGATAKLVDEAKEAGRFVPLDQAAVGTLPTLGLTVTVDAETARELEAIEDVKVDTYLAGEVTRAIEDALNSDNFAEGLILRYRAFHVTVAIEEAN